MQNQYKRIAIKVGSNVLTKDDGMLNIKQINHLVSQISLLHEQGIELILISSGAVAAGRSDIEISKKTSLVASKQVLAAIGQVKLMSLYLDLFSNNDIQSAQVLTTKENFGDRRHYLNMKNCISAMLENNIIPIVNENDTISVTELMFTDNDELSGLIASMMDCDALLILSNVDGIFTGKPGDKDVELIPTIDESTGDLEQYISTIKSGFGRGGMLTKCTIAKKIASEGIEVIIANGTRKNIIHNILESNETPCTRFVANKIKSNGVKKWLSHSDTFAKGIVIINKGAKEALMGSKATSLLLIGIERIEGLFEKGDIVRIFDEKANQLGIGKSQYDSVKANELKGEKRKKPFIHYDYLLLNEN
ncbi:MAG: glutamate 5-kinase [Salinivirgaceae bacterium]|nr:glutamate 5-kinase [Salinivirgaceae bacterium]